MLAPGRVAWIDFARGLAIILVAMIYAAMGYADGAPGPNWMLAVAAWAHPMTLPAFFLIAGLLLPQALFRSAPVYFDCKVAHLAYFYAVWLAVHILFFQAGFLLKNPVGFLGLYASGWVIPDNPLWFIHQLALFYITTRLVRRAPAARVLAGAAVLQIVHAAGLFQTGWPVADRFAEFYVYFFAGYAAAPVFFRFAQAVTERARDIIGALALWFVVHTAFVALGIANLPLVSLILGFAGIFAVVAAGVALSCIPSAHIIGKLGGKSLAIYLGVFIPMFLLQNLLTAANIYTDAGTASLVVAIVSVVASYTLYRTLLETPLRLLYVRPPMFRLKTANSARRGSLLSSTVPEG